MNPIKKVADYFCGAENTKGLAKLGYVASFLASGTDCRCCLGTRILIGFAVGFFLGAVWL